MISSDSASHQCSLAHALPTSRKQDPKVDRVVDGGNRVAITSFE
jgi:hypothetical protein